MMMLKEVEGFWHKQFSGAAKVEAFSRSGIELPGNGIELGLRESSEIGSLGKILAKQAIGILIDAALPRAVRIGEIDRDASDFGKARMLRHLAPLVVGQGKASLRVNPVEDSAKGSGRGFGRGVLHLDQGDEERGPLDQRADGRGIAGTFDQIPLPVAGNNALGDLRRA